MIRPILFFLIVTLTTVYSNSRTYRISELNENQRIAVKKIVSQKDMSLCESDPYLSSEKLTRICKLWFAYNYGNYKEVCNVDLPTHKNIRCVGQIAKGQKNPDICNVFKLEGQRALCLKTSDKSLLINMGEIAKPKNVSKRRKVREQKKKSQKAEPKKDK